MARRPVQETASDLDFELRADHVPETALRQSTARTDFFGEIQKALLDRSLTLIEGPRGCGKTHMMRFAWLTCLEDEDKPLAVYVSFNRYLRLEPMLRSRPDALLMFQSWVIGRTALAVADVMTRLGCADQAEILSGLGLPQQRIESLVRRLERRVTLSGSEIEDANALSIDSLIEVIEAATEAAGRRRAVLLLDDAALTLTPEYLFEFFDVVRLLKQAKIAPKCSEYPGTEHGPRFHTAHESRRHRVWLSVEHPNYLSDMLLIGATRFKRGTRDLDDDVKALLAYAAFGVPRAYLRLLRDVSEGSGNQQVRFNNAVQQLRDEQLEVYDSLEAKAPRFATIVKAGRKFFNNAVERVADANIKASGDGDGDADALDLSDGTRHKQLLIGVLSTDLGSLATRMLSMLAEAGLLYEYPEVSHGGPERRYRRFMPHLAPMITNRSFAARSRGWSIRSELDFLRRKAAKHPIRTVLAGMLGRDDVQGLKLDLPPCQFCNTARKDASSKFCHECGNRLSDPSTYISMLRKPVSEVPTLSRFMKDSLEARGIKTIQDLLSIQDPATELQKSKFVGPVRADRVVSLVENYVDEFLS